MTRKRQSNRGTRTVRKKYIDDLENDEKNRKSTAKGYDRDKAKYDAKQFSELTTAKTVRTKEAKDFSKSEIEQGRCHGHTPARVISIIEEKKMVKNHAFLQKRIDTQNMNDVVALVQSRLSSNEDDDELSAPVAAVHKSNNSNIVDLLNDFWTKPRLSSNTHATPRESSFRAEGHRDESLKSQKRNEDQLLLE